MILDWVISFTSFVMLWAMGDRKWWAPILGIANQFIWVAFVMINEKWGLLPGVILYTAVHARNAYKWMKSRSTLESA